MRPVLLFCMVWIAVVPAVGPALAGSPDLQVEFPRNAGTVGDRFPLTLTAVGDGAEGWEPLPLPDRVGSFQVFDGTWSATDPGDQPRGWVWTGSLAAYEPGTLQVPAIPIRFRVQDEILEASTDPLEVTIESVLAAEGEDVELADLKGPAALDPDYSALIVALSVLFGLVLVAGIVRWLQRRYAGRLAAVPQPPDPFQRMPPHEWAYQALKELLKEGRADPEHAGSFFQEIARILKLYMGARYRVEIMECTTAEVAPLLRQAGSSEEAILRNDRILAFCDRVKFADHRPPPAEFRSTVEEAYALVDSTRPLEQPGQGAS